MATPTVPTQARMWVPSTCNDANSDESPANPEDQSALCRDSLDNDCDALIDQSDPGCTAFVDDDGDGFCEDGRDINGDGDCLDLTEDDGSSDCNDGAAGVYPGAIENCNDGLDNDCDGDLDTADVECLDRTDDDGDGFCEVGRDTDGDGTCVDPGEENFPGDCNDTASEINPLATEVCDDSIDNDCDGRVDGEQTVCTPVVDLDGDGHCPMGRDLNGDGDCLDPGESAGPSDCDDMDESVSPTELESSQAACVDAVDNNCDGQVDAADSGCLAFLDLDGDGYCPSGIDGNGDGDCLDVEELDEPGDCDELRISINPGVEEICDNGVDDDCDGAVDGSDAACGDRIDDDNDGSCELGVDLNDDGDCEDPGEEAGPFDCNDSDPAIGPTQTEVCDDGVDNDCSGAADLADMGCAAFVDSDGDGVCPRGRDLTDDRDCLDDGEDLDIVDCDDGNINVSPELDEICGDMIDNDCNGLVDSNDGERCLGTLDNDGDGWCPAGEDRNEDGDCRDANEDSDAGDCDDSNAAIGPHAEELCDDELDNNCDGWVDAADPSCDPARFDRDGDGWCPSGRDRNADADCSDDGEDHLLGDCDDTNASVRPGALELCADEVDNDCNRLVDSNDPQCDGDPTQDEDADGYCAMAGRDLNGDGDCDDTSEGTGDVDCNDADPGINPGEPEICGDGIDQNCNGEVDDIAVCDPDSTEDDPSGYSGGACGCRAPGSGRATPRMPVGAALLGLVALGWLRRRRRDAASAAPSQNR